ncbi:MAG: DUF445 family protein [Opitutae bacterium]|nr:DUF445 family protein [Opitutae bacterium]
MSPIIFLLPIIAAIIGWLTNYLAVKMLFHPKVPINVLGISIHGVFPKRQKTLAEKLGSLVAKELFSIGDITKKIEDIAKSEKSMELIGKRIEKTIRNKLVKSFPMLAMFLTDDMVEKVTNLFKSELQDFLTDFSQDIRERLEENIDVEKLVRDKVEAFSSDKLEQILFAIMKKEFRFIEIIGAVLGFIIGCFQVGLTLFINK